MSPLTQTLGGNVPPVPPVSYAPASGHGQPKNTHLSLACLLEFFIFSYFWGKLFPLGLPFLQSKVIPFCLNVLISQCGPWLWFGGVYRPTCSAASTLSL